MDSLEAVEVKTNEAVELLRQIRNATATGFSHDNTQISENAQRAWWIAMRGRVRAWLYYAPYDGPLTWKSTLVGFGLVRQTEDGRWWNSLGVLPSEQGKGYGSAITADLLEQHGGELWATVKKDNLPAIAMHHTDQWEQPYVSDERDVNDPLVYFRSKT